MLINQYRDSIIVYFSVTLATWLRPLRSTSTTPPSSDRRDFYVVTKVIEPGGLQTVVMVAALPVFFCDRYLELPLI